jgi:hypothetical protein
LCPLTLVSCVYFVEWGQYPIGERKTRHNLTKALVRANDLGLAAIVPITKQERDELTKANKYYADKGFEYFEVISAVTGYPDLPDITQLEIIAERLVTAIVPLCLNRA